MSESWSHPIGVCLTCGTWQRITAIRLAPGATFISHGSKFRPCAVCGQDGRFLDGVQTAFEGFVRIVADSAQHLADLVAASESLGAAFKAAANMSAVGRSLAASKAVRDFPAVAAVHAYLKREIGAPGAGIAILALLAGVGFNLAQLAGPRPATADEIAHALANALHQLVVPGLPNAKPVEPQATPTNGEPANPKASHPPAWQEPRGKHTDR